MSVLWCLWHLAGWQEGHPSSCRSLGHLTEEILPQTAGGMKLREMSRAVLPVKRPWTPSSWCVDIIVTSRTITLRAPPLNWTSRLPHNRLLLSQSLLYFMCIFLYFPNPDFILSVPPCVVGKYRCFKTPILLTLLHLCNVKSVEFSATAADCDYRKAILTKLRDMMTSEQSDRYVQQLDIIERKERLIRGRLTNGLC